MQVKDATGDRTRLQPSLINDLQTGLARHKGLIIAGLSPRDQRGLSEFDYYLNLLIGSVIWS